MGCGSSKMGAVSPSTELKPQPRSEQPPSSQSGVQQEREVIERRDSSMSTGSKKSIKIRQNKISPMSRGNGSVSTPGIIKVQEADSQRNNSDSDSSQYSSSESINNSNTRLISAHSTESKGSQDSGLGDDYAHVITEGSDSADKEIAKIPEGMERPDLTIDGEKIKTLSSMGHRKRPVRLPPIQLNKGSSSSSESSMPTGLSTKRVTFSSSLIDELPDSPSIIKKPCAKGGLAFDIVLEDTPVDQTEIARRKPAHLQKLEQRRSKVETVSHEELDEKQRAAEQRRKEQSQMLLERLRAKQEKDRQVAEALAKFAAMQTEIKNGVNKKIETTTEKREAYLKAMRDRLKEKSEKVEAVRNAKKLVQPQSITTSQKDDTPVNN